MHSLHSVKLWLKTSDNDFAKHAFYFAKQIRTIEIPAPKLFFSLFYHTFNTLKNTLSTLLRVFVWTPMFKSQLTSPAKKLYLYGGLPYIGGSLQITVGARCRISAHTTFTGRVNKEGKAQLIIGDNVGIGWMTTIAVGRKIIIGNNVRVAGQAFLAGYPGHPVNAVDRAEGLPDTDDQVGDIVLNDDVWLGSGVRVLPNVTIGARTIVATGSVVTKDLPADVLAAGIPAKVVKSLENKGQL